MTLARICRTCGGEGRMIKSRYGGNDPDTWDAGPCENDDCDNGYEPIWCEGWRCSAPATELIDGEPFCDEHAREWRADQTDAGPVSGEAA